MFNLGFSELLLLGVIALVFIGPNQLPEMARTIGRLLNELKRAGDDFKETFTQPLEDDIRNRIQSAREEVPKESLPATPEGDHKSES